MKIDLSKAVQYWTLLHYVLGHRVRVKKKERTPEQLLSVPCPTCGVPAGEGCVLHSGTPRSEPHVDRKLDAIEAIERE
jgi:hypothetical protein